MITKIKPQRISYYPVYSVDSLADLNKLKSRTSVGLIAIYNGKEFTLDLQRNWITNASPIWYSELNENYSEYGNFTINNITTDYDIEKRIMYIIPQENTDDIMYFALGE